MRLEVLETRQHVVIEQPEVTVVEVPSVEEVRIIAVAEQGPPAALTYRVFAQSWSANTAIDWSRGELCRLTLGGNTNLTFSGAFDGQRCMLELKQDAEGGRTIQLPGNVRFSPSLSSVDLSTSPNAIDRLGFIYNGATGTYDLVAFMYGYV